MTAHREVIDVPGLHHGKNPTPAAVRVGNMVFSSGIFGMDPASGEVPDDAATQVGHVFSHMRTIVTNAGGSVNDIGFVLFRIADDGVRGLVNDAWLEMFPDDGSRPARNTQVDALGWNQVIHVMMTAVLP